MELTYRLEQYEGPLDLLLQLIQKNKMDIMDIQISVICDQYIAFIEQIQAQDLEVASEFIDMASELILIKSKMLIPKVRPDEPDPREDLTENLLRYQQAKQAAAKMAELYTKYSARMVKDTDEVSVDKTFVADQDVTRLCQGIRSIIAYNEEIEKNEREKVRFTPLMASPIVPVEVKILGILRHVNRSPKPTMKELLRDAESLPDLIAIFLGILELVKVQQLLIVNDDDNPDDSGIANIHDMNTSFVLNDKAPETERIASEYDHDNPSPMETVIGEDKEGQLEVVPTTEAK